MRWPEGPPHLALNPPYLFFCFCFVFVLFCFFAFYFGGFKGQVRWPEFCTLSYHFVFFFCPQFSGNFLKIAFFKKRVQNLGFSVFSVLSLNYENSLFLGLLKHYKNRGFSTFLCSVLLKEKKTGKRK